MKLSRGRIGAGFEPNHCLLALRLSFETQRKHHQKSKQGYQQPHLGPPFLFVNKKFVQWSQQMKNFLFISLVMIFRVLVVDWLKVNEVCVAAG